MITAMTAKEIFEYYRTITTLSPEDEADFRVYLQDPTSYTDGQMAVAGLTLNVIEKGWDENKLLLMLTSCDGISTEVFERVLVGVILIMIQHDVYIRRDRVLVDDIQEILTFAPELSYTALCNIARTTQMRHIEQFNAQLTQELMPLINNRESDEFYDIIQRRQSEMEHIAAMQLDQNFLIFKEFYATPFFRTEAANWLLPWDDEALINIDEEDREEIAELMQVWPMCDSDKYALCYMYRSFKSVIKSQLSVESLREVGINMQNKLIVTNGYIQQLYRYFRLSAHTQAKPFEIAHQLRNLLIYRLVVVGEKAKETIDKLIS
jgi:hypothetical protein